MTGSNWVQLSGGSTNPWNIIRDDGTYTASYGDHVISDGGTVTLPSPQQGAAVAVSEIGNSSVTVDGGSAQVEQQSTLNTGNTNEDEVVFVSDGSNWYVASDLDNIIEIPDSGVARYEFEQNVTDSWFDNDGSEVGGISYSTDSQYGTYSLDLDGVDDYIDLSAVANSGEFSQIWSGAFSVSQWFKTTTSDVGFLGEAYRNNDRPWDLRVLNGNLETARPPASTITASGSVDDGNWHHAVFTNSGDTSSDAIKLYLDGNFEGEDSADADFGDTLDTLYIGARNSPTGFFAGQIDRTEFYSKELTSTEVSNLYNTGSI